MGHYINLAEQKLLNSIKKKECIFFIGSGISKFAPTNLPDAFELKAVLLNTLKYFLSNKELISNLVKNNHLRPEICFQYFYKYVKDPLLSIFELFMNTAPNQCHFFIAKLLQMNYIDFVVTTNYDDGIESVLDMAGVKYKSIVTENEFQNSSTKPESVSIFKLHGCARRDLRSCLLNMEDVSFDLAKAKVETLRKISEKDTRMT